MAKLKSGSLLSVIKDICADTGACPMLVYLAEAHSHENWPLSLQAPSSHADMSQRMSAANTLLADFPEFAELLQGHVYTDMLDDNATLAYGLWPERYLLVERGTVQWASTLSFEARSTDLPVLLRRAASDIWVQELD